MKLKLGPVAQFLAIGVLVGSIAPFFLSLCLFGTTLQVFMAAEPTPGYWSGAATPMPTAVPGQLQVWTSAALAHGQGAAFVVWGILGALAGEAVGDRWPGGHPWQRGRRAWLGAIAGSLLFSMVALFIFLP